METPGVELGTVERAVLAACRDAMRAVAARPDPPGWMWWAAGELADLRAFGPRYAPAAWFGGGRPLPERVRVRCLRAVRRLAAAGLVERTDRGNRLTFLRLTPAGERAAAAAGPDDPASAGDPEPAAAPGVAAV